MTSSEVLSILTSEQESRRKARKVLIGISLAILGLMAGSLGFLIAKGNSDTSTILMMSGILPMLGAGIGFTPRAKGALREIIDQRDPAAIGFLIEALGSGDPDLVKISQSALAEMLPHQPPGTVALDSVQYVSLLNHLAVCDDAFAQTLVRSFPVMARPEMIPLLQSMVDEKYPRSGRDKASIKGAAMTALPDVRLQLAREVVLKAVEEADQLRLRTNLKFPAGSVSEEEQTVDAT